MASFSRAGPDFGIRDPDDVEIYHVVPEEDEYMVEQESPLLVIMWHGNGYKRDDCWVQVDEDAACDLGAWQ